MSERRREFVMMAFDRLDTDGSGQVTYDDIKDVYNASKHPDVLSGKKTEKEVLLEFLGNFEKGGQVDGVITREEFVNYYHSIGVGIDRDDYFELMIRNAWHLSGGKGCAENTTNMRVLVTHLNGNEEIVTLKNDLGLTGRDKAAIVTRLKSQGVSSIADVKMYGALDDKDGGGDAAGKQVKKESPFADLIQGRTKPPPFVPKKRMNAQRATDPPPPGFTLTRLNVATAAPPPAPGTSRSLAETSINSPLSINSQGDSSFGSFNDYLRRKPAPVPPPGHAKPMTAVSGSGRRPSNPTGGNAEAYTGGGPRATLNIFGSNGQDQDDRNRNFNVGSPSVPAQQVKPRPQSAGTGRGGGGGSYFRPKASVDGESLSNVSSAGSGSFTAISNAGMRERLKSMKLKAVVLYGQKRYKEAEPIFVDTLRLLESAVGADHQDCIKLRKDIAACRAFDVA